MEASEITRNEPPVLSVPNRFRMKRVFVLTKG
jgi:hypothetical protein